MYGKRHNKLWTKAPGLSLIVIICLYFLALLVSGAYGLSKAPDFTIPDTDGTTFSLSDYRGQVVLLEFMQTSSPQCIEEIAHLKSVQNEYGNDLTILSLSIDTNDTDDVLKAFKSEHNTDWRYAKGPYSLWHDTYNVTEVPTIFLIDQEGYLRSRHENVVEATILSAEIHDLWYTMVPLSTLPSLEGVHFKINGDDYYTASSGNFSVELRVGLHEVFLVDTVISEPGLEYHFKEWGGNYSGSTNPLSVNISSTYAALSIQAFFDLYDTASPVADAGPDQLVDVNQIMVFDASASTDNNNISDYAWTFFDGTPQTLTGVNPTYLFTTIGTYTVTLNVSDAAGNWATDTVLITVQDLSAPIAEAGSDQTVPEDTLVVLDGTASSDNLNITSYVWSFVDNGSRTLVGAVQTYMFQTPGVYHVTLNVSDGADNWATDTVLISVTDVTLPLAQAGGNQTVHEGAITVLDGSGSTDNGGIVSYIWTLFDETPITLLGPKVTYVFTTPGIYQIALNVTDGDDNSATDIIFVAVIDVNLPIADAGYDRIVEEQQVITLNGSGSWDENGIDQYLWTFIDSYPRTLQGENPTYTFVHPGKYTIVLQVMDSSGNIASDSVTIIVRDVTHPIADAGLDQAVDKGVQVTFDASRSTDNVEIVSYEWDYGDGITGTGITSRHIYAEAGNYIVTLTVRDQANNVGTDQISILVGKIDGRIVQNWFPLIVVFAGVNFCIYVLKNRK